MDERWRWDRVKLHGAMIFLLSCIFLCNPSLCATINNEGSALLKFKDRVVKDPFGALSSWKLDDGYLDHCSWFGIECSDGKVVALNLRDLLLEGTLAPELGQLTHIRSIILRNNSFSGVIPEDISKLKGLKVVDLGHNNFTGLLPLAVGNNTSLLIFLVDNNKYINKELPETDSLKMFSESKVDEYQLGGASSKASCKSRPSSENTGQSGKINNRRLMQVTGSFRPSEADRSKSRKRNSKAPISAASSSPFSPSPSPSFHPHLLAPTGSPLSSISITPSASVSSHTESPSPSPSKEFSPSPSPVLPPTPALPPEVKFPFTTPKLFFPAPPHSSSAPRKSVANTDKSTDHLIFILSGAIGMPVCIFVAALGFVYCRNSKIVSVKPWATGLSGQLQKAFVAGVPKLQRSELDTACEDFSNIIGSLSGSTIYKGTLSSGVEIAVVSSAVKSAEDWSIHFEAHFRNKIDTLSKVNHKNFVNLIGYCEEEEPFTRMMVFEYAPNGTLYEHLHIKEAEHLDWRMRMRIAMGIAYCLEYMEELPQSIALEDLQSSSVYLTEDYAAKIADLSIFNDVSAAKTGAVTMELLNIPASDLDTNVFNFGIVLLEMITGMFPHLVGNGSLADWASVHLNEEQSLRDFVDPNLKSFKEEEVKKLVEVVKDCVLPDPKQRPKMREVAIKLREITALGPDVATPRASPLWWAELEIFSTESS